MSEIASAHIIYEPELEEDDMLISKFFEEHPNLKKEFTPGVVATNQAPADSAQSLLNQHWMLNFQEAYKVTCRNTIGRCLIINNRIFNTTSLTERHGTGTDCQSLRRLFEDLLKYHVTICNNCTADEIFSHCSTFLLDGEFERFDSCILCILSHGKEDYIYGTDGKAIKVKEILHLFNHANCKLKGKPKLVIIQACRTTVKKSLGKLTCFGGNTPDFKPDGTATGDFQEMVNQLRELNMKDELMLQVAAAPANFDIIIAYSALPGQLSWRNKTNGSCFIQALVQVFTKRNDSEHVADMLVMVRKIVCKAFHGLQIPHAVNNLFKKFYFFP